MRQHSGLPSARREYDQWDEQTTRLTIEQEMKDLRNELQRVELSLNRASTMTARRHQFLFLGSDL